MYFSAFGIRVHDKAIEVLKSFSTYEIQDKSESEEISDVIVNILVCCVQ